MKQTKLRGEQLAKAVVNQILAHPETWNQRSWCNKNECGTQYCFAGWAVVLAGLTFSKASVKADAMDVLGITDCEAQTLFAVSVGLKTLYTFAKNHSNGYNWAGYDKDGYDRTGYCRDGSKLEMKPFNLEQ